MRSRRNDVCAYRRAEQGHPICTAEAAVRKSLCVFLLGSLLVFSACKGFRSGSPSGEAGRTRLEAKLDGSVPPDFVSQDDEGRHLWQEERRFYKQNRNRLVWSDGKRLGSQVDELTRAIQAADQEGLDPADYDATAVGALRSTSF